MNIEPGTRVRSTQEGTYLFKGDMYHCIQWDKSKQGWLDIHAEDEFEVIDE